MVHVVGEVHAECMRAGVWVLSRVHSREVLIFDEYRAVCRGERGESEGALEVLARRGVVEIDRVGVKDVVAIGCYWVHVLACRVCGR